MVILVTGGSGFVGSHLLKSLLKHKKEVRVLDIRDCANKDVEFIKGDIRNIETLDKVTKNIDSIFHLASLVPQSNVNYSAYVDTIVKGTENTLKICLAKNIKLVHVSSSGVYGGGRQFPLKEDDPKNPQGAYGITKWQAEIKCQEYVKKGVDVVIVRPMAIIGPGIYGVFKKFISYVHNSYPLPTFGNGNNKIQMVSVHDCVDALLLAEKYIKPGETFNLGSDNIPTVKEEFKSLIDYSKSKSIVLPVPAILARTGCKILYKLKISPLTPEHYYVLDKNSILDNTKAKTLLGWTPKFDNIQMLKEAYDWYVNETSIQHH
ncbi:MAG: NAD(P)-dependent oxidoreductase [Nanoarchaeota archaeon]